MSEKPSIKIDDRLDNNYNDELTQMNNINNIPNISVEKENQNEEVLTTLKENVLTLEKQKRSLEIENTCLLQENKNLQTKIDDLARLYPSAVALLGKTSDFNKKRRKWIFKRK